MKKQDEIAQLINGSRKKTHTFISQVNGALRPERASFSEIAHALRKLSPERRTPQSVIAVLKGEPKEREYEEGKCPIEARHIKFKGSEHMGQRTATDV